MNFKENLKQLRLLKGLTQEDLANLLNVPKGTLRNWEQGIREPNKLEILAELKKILECTYDELLK